MTDNQSLATTSTGDILPVTINPAQLAILTQRTPPEQVRFRTGRGGKELAYVDHAFVTGTLNQAFGWNWDFETNREEIYHIGERPFEAKVHGRLTVRLPNGTVIVKEQYGCQPIEMLKDGSAPVSIGDTLKGAASDALKKCASLLGIALDLYDSDGDTVQGGRRGNDQQRREQPIRPQATKPQAAPATVVISPDGWPGPTWADAGLEPGWPALRTGAVKLLGYKDEPTVSATIKTLTGGQRMTGAEVWQLLREHAANGKREQHTTPTGGGER